jgi:hypothetical protein
MALQGVFFCAHQNDVRRARQHQRAINPRAKIRGLAAFLVVYDAILVIGAGIGRPAAESFAEKFVSDFRRRKASFERLAVELREPETAGAAANVADDFYFMSQENFQEAVQFETRMSDGKDRRVGVRRWLHGKGTQQARRILPKGGEVGKRENPAGSCAFISGFLGNPE